MTMSNAKFTAIEGPDKGSEFLFDKGHEWIFGLNKDTCQFLLKDSKIANEQARIVLKEKGQYFITNLSDDHPLFIGNEEIHGEKLLHDEDKVKMGDSWFLFSETKASLQEEAKTNEYDSFFEETVEASEEILPGLSQKNKDPEKKPSLNREKEIKADQNETRSEPPIPPPPADREENLPYEKPSGDFTSDNIEKESTGEKLPAQEPAEALKKKPSKKEDDQEESSASEIGHDRDSTHYDTIFEDLGDQDTFHDLSDDYMGSERFILKVLAGPNTGAEFALQKGCSYIIGTDVTGADVIFNDLSVSRHHARLSLSDEGEILVEDLKSRNGVIIDGEQIEGQRSITPKNMVTLGTTTFIVIDRESSEETYITEPPSKIVETQKEEPPKEEGPEKIKKFEKPKREIKESTFILTGVLFAVILVLGIGAVTLFKSSPVEHPHLDFTKEIQTALGANYPDVKYTYNPTNGTLFLLGHVLTTVDKEELLYTLNNLNFVSQIEDNVVVDDAVAQEMNLVLSRYPAWRSISIHSPQPGRFIMSGYLPTREGGAELEDFVNVQFPYIDRLSNYVVIEEDLNQEVVSKLHNYGFYSVQVELANGEVSLSGYINSTYEKAFEKTIREISRMIGVRNVNNYVVIVRQSKKSEAIESKLPYASKGAPGSIGQKGEPKKSAKAVIEKFGSWLQDSDIANITDYQEQSMDVTAMYHIEGFADQGAVGRAVVINGRILTVGDTLNGMKILAILDRYVFLEKNGLKYKIEFNR